MSLFFLAYFKDKIKKDNIKILNLDKRLLEITNRL